MAQVPNLLDMLRNNRDADKAQAAKPADVKLAAKTGKASQTLLPIDPVTPGAGADKPKGGKTAPGSFQAKVDKSRAKLAAAVNQKSPVQPKPAVKTEAAKPAKNEPAGKTGPVRSARAEKPALRDRDDSAPATVANKSAAPINDKTAQPATVRPDAAPDQGMDEETVARIQDGLEDMGIEVDDSQMNDPAFLMEMLRLLQAMPAVQPDAPAPTDAAMAEAAPVESQAEAGLAAVDTAPLAEPEAADPAAQSEKPISRKDLADLIAGRIDGMQMAAQAEKAAAPQVSAQAPTVTRKEWQGIQVRPQTETIATDPLPMADLDRLRVLQAAALQAGPKAGENAAADFSIETDNVDAVSDAPAAVQAATEHDSAADGDADAQADLFGRNGDQTGNAEASARKEGPLVAREGATGPQFNQALEQARTVDHRAGIQRGMEPRAGGPEAAVLEQIAKKMSAVARKNGDEINIQLSPEHLGKVRVSLEMKEGAMMARIAVENDSVRKQVEDNLGSLRDALANQGIKLQGLEVSVDQRHSSLFNPDGSNSESFFHRRGQGGEAGQGERENTAFETAPESETGRRWGYNTMEYIG